MKKQKKKSGGPICAAAPKPALPPDAFGAEAYRLRQSEDSRLLRQCVPLLDGAVTRAVRLTGGFRAECDTDRRTELLNETLAQLSVNGCMSGTDVFLSAYLDALLTDGTAVGQMTLDPDSGALQLWNVPLSRVRLRRQGTRVAVCSADDANDRPVPAQASFLLSMLDPRPGEIYGTPLLGGLQPMAGLMLQIFEAMRANWARSGNIRYAVTYDPKTDADRMYAAQRAQEIAEQWGKAMSSPEVHDFVAVGDVAVKVIGADNQLMDSDVPVRQCLEQMVAKTGIPPFLLGLSWSTTEKMAQQQADMLITQLYHYRRLVTPALLRICRTALRIAGEDCAVRVRWDDISLADTQETAKANYYNALAAQAASDAGTQPKEDITNAD